MNKIYAYREEMVNNAKGTVYLAGTTLKDALSIEGIKEISTCGNNAIRNRKPALYEGVLIKESIESENILDYIYIKETFINDNLTIKYNI